MQSPASPPEALDALLYISKATVPFTDSDLEGLLVRARHLNEQNGLTGLLMYDYIPALKLGQFCQYIEGPPEALAEARVRIERDRRHAGLHVLHEGPAEVRLFTSWSMGYMPASALPDVDGFRTLLDVTIPYVGAMKRPAALMRVFLKMSNRA